MFLNEKLEIVEKVKDKVKIKNVAMYHQFAKVFNLPTLAKETFRCMERCFSMVVENSNFLQSEFTVVSRLLSSSKLNICSELEVFHAADAWLSNTVERHVFLKDLFLKIRFSLLSDHEVEHVLQTPSTFISNENSSFLANEILQDRENFYLRNKSSHITRYCDHDEFNIIVMGGNFGFYQYATEIDARRRITPLRNFDLNTEDFTSVCVNNEVYVFGDAHHPRPISVQKYSPGLDAEWQHLCHLDSLNHVCITLCAFMSKIYVMGGLGDMGFMPDCIEFDTKNCEWKRVCDMHESRAKPASAVFEGRVVACGGRRALGVDTTTVEAYDHIADQWSYMPSMIEARVCHKMVALRNKLFVFGTSKTNEVFDSVCKKFVYLKPPEKSLTANLEHLNDATLVKNKVTIFINGSPLMAVYDVDTDEWSEESCGQFTSVVCQRYASVRHPVIF